MAYSMLILGIETSCDETAVSLINPSLAYPNRILVNLIHSQIPQHQPFGGVVPELAAREHLHYLMPLVEKAFRQANHHLDDLDAIGVTAGPGLIGGILVGLMFGKGLSFGLGKPFYAINQLEAHGLTVRLCEIIDFPYLLLLASGGHCQYLLVNGVSQYQLLGQTVDDAAGEAFDKVAKLLDLPYPGGVSIEDLARSGNDRRFNFPHPMVHEKGCTLSFSGLKNAVRIAVQKQTPLSTQDQADIAASFQRTIVETLVRRTINALDGVGAKVPLVVAGGVAANKLLRSQLDHLCHEQRRRFVCPPIALCTDNAAIIAWSCYEQIACGIAPSSYDTGPKPYWPLSDLRTHII